MSRNAGGCASPGADSRRYVPGRVGPPDGPAQSSCRCLSDQQDAREREGGDRPAVDSARLRQVEGVKVGCAVTPGRDSGEARLPSRPGGGGRLFRCMVPASPAPITEEHTRFIGKRVGSIVGAVNVQLKALRKRGNSTASQEALLSAIAPLSLSPPPKKSATPAAAPPPPPPLDPAPPLPESRRAPPPPLILVPGECSQEMMAACEAANKVESADRSFEGWLRVAEDNCDDEDFCLDDDEEYLDVKVELEIWMLEYKRRLQRLARAQPELGLVPEEDCLCQQATGPLCPCGSGARVAAQFCPPWLLQLESGGFCIARPGECDWEGCWEQRYAIMTGNYD